MTFLSELTSMYDPKQVKDISLDVSVFIHSLMDNILHETKVFVWFPYIYELLQFSGFGYGFEGIRSGTCIYFWWKQYKETHRLIWLIFNYSQYLTPSYCSVTSTVRRCPDLLIRFQNFSWFFRTYISTSSELSSLTFLKSQKWLVFQNV